MIQFMQDQGIWFGDQPTFIGLGTLLLQVTLLGLLIWSGARLLERQSATLAHFVSAAGLCALLTFPALAWLGKNWAVSLPVLPDAVSSVSESFRLNYTPHETDGRASPLRPLPNAGEYLADAAIHASNETTVAPLPKASRATQLEVSVAATPEVSRSNAGADRAAVDDNSFGIRNTPGAKTTLMGLVIVWLSVFLLYGIRLVRSVILLRAVVKRTHLASVRMQHIADELKSSLGVHWLVELRVDSQHRMPVSFWWRRWTIVVPSAAEHWTEGRVRTVLAHELAHVARRDAWYDLAGELAICVYWFHPLVIWLRADSRRLREQACDDLVLYKCRTTRTNYAQHLVDVVAECSANNLRLATPMAGSNEIERRIRRILSSARPAIPSQIVRSLTIGLLAILVTGLISVRLSSAEQVNLPVSVDAKPSPASTAPPALNSNSFAGERMNVSGVVLDEVGQRVAGASVRLRVAPHAFGSLMLNETYLEVLASTQSDEQGRFRFENVLIPEPFRGHRPYSNRRFPYEVIVDTKTHGLSWASFRETQVQGLEVGLQPRSPLSGTVVNAAGEPVPDALVSVNAISKASVLDYDPFVATPAGINFTMSQMPPQTKTDAEGQFVFEQMPLDSLVAISVRHNDYSYLGALVAVGPRAEPKTYRQGPHQITAIESPARLTIQPGLKLDVRVVRDGRPVSGPANLNGKSVFIEPIEVEPGRYRTAVREAGLYFFYVADSEREMTVTVPLTLRAKHLESPLTQTITIPPTRALSGRVIVKETGQPVPDVRVRWSQSDTEPQQSRTAAVTTDAQGRFTIQVVPGAGKLSLSGESTQALVLDPAKVRTNVPPPGYYHDVDVPTEGMVQPITIEVSQGLQIVGKVQDAAAKPLADQRVSIMSLGAATEERRETKTDREGRYAFAGLTPHQTYSLSSLSSDFVAREVVQEDKSASLVDSARKEVDLTARPGVTLVGRVLEDQQPVEGVVIDLLVGHPVGDDGMAYEQVASARTDAQGLYRLAALLPGDVYQVTTNLTHQFDPRWRYGSSYRVTLPSDARDEYKLDDMHLLRYEQTLAGQVIDPEGKPVAGAMVSARMADGDFVRRVGDLPPPWAKTDADGRFELQSLPNQVLKLMAHIQTSDQGGPIRFPAEVKTQLNQRDVRILLDPSLLEE